MMTNKTNDQELKNNYLQNYNIVQREFLLTKNKFESKVRSKMVRKLTDLDFLMPSSSDEEEAQPDKKFNKRPSKVRTK